MKLLLRCVPERVDNTYPDFALLTLDSKIAAAMERRYNTYQTEQAKDLYLSDMVWQDGSLRVKFYYVGCEGEPNSVLLRLMQNDVIEPGDDFEVPAECEQVNVENVTFEVGFTGKMVIGGTVSGAIYNHFHTTNIPLGTVRFVQSQDNKNAVHALDNHKALGDRAWAENLWIDGTAFDDTYQGDAIQGPWVVFDVNAQMNIAGPFEDDQDARNALLAILEERGK